MSDLEHLIENAVIAVEEGTEFADFQNAERTKTLLAATDMFINDVWEIAQYAVTTLKQDWKAKWEEDLKKNAGSPSPSEIYTQSCGIHADSAASHAPQLIFDGEPIKLHHQMEKRESSETTSSQVARIEPKEIYRGKTDSTGEWVYGSLIEYPDGDKYICVPTAFPWVLDKYKVIPETVGKWIRLCDKNKAMIFEGDVFKFDDEAWEGYFSECGTEWDSTAVENYAAVGFDDDESRYDFVRYKYTESSVKADLHENHDLEFSEFVAGLEIVGNVHDNPEMLECDSI